MALRSIGKVVVTTGGTPVRATSGQADPTKRYPCYSFLVEALPANTGKVYIGMNAGINRTSLDKVVAILPIPTTNNISSFSATSPAVATNGFDLSTIWIDVDVNGEGVLISAIEG